MKSLTPLALSLVVRPTVAPPCLNKGNPLPLRSSLLFCLGRNYTSQGQVSDLPAREVMGAEEGGRFRDSRKDQAAGVLGAGVVGVWALRGGLPASEVGVQPRGDQMSRSGEPESPLAAGSLGSSLDCVCVCVCVGVCVCVHARTRPRGRRELPDSISHLVVGG